MASVNLDMDVIEDQSARRGHQGDHAPLIKYYRVSELIPAPKLPLHHLLKREPAVWAAMQICSGVLSIGLGVMFAASFHINDLLLTMFRIPIMSGIMFLFAGFLSTLLYRHPGLLQMCFQSNIFCLCTAAIGAVLLCVDLGKVSQGPDYYPNYHQVEILLLCVTLLDMVISFILIVLIFSEKRRQQKK